ncbi:TonB-dependent siderophore receptor [Sphingomonas sp. HITSZ_GF]|uniref:TonB-dependent siderophore receptor n=1 Tax=Sphingomonas sp. HITSZ_GF TaxID=3037247 RepID=UPI00240CFB31|nr:TonB-dependent siderophore receptor [Sphingomonas sp. HITSZ_GF]MDG2534184.1 TonB-dependent siderophore receptor [Sphingomonas sp. HITSZ_GF]
MTTFDRRAAGVQSTLRHILAGAALVAMPGVAWAQTDTDTATAEQEKGEGEIVVTGINVPTTTSTGLALTFMETPQSVTIIDQKRIQDYALTGTKELLKQAVGLNVDDQETDRTVYNARGFDVINFQVDGIGLPLLANLTYGDTDTFQYERVDIVRGANGLTTGIGNPSAMINYIRKRPLATMHVSAAGYAGSWNQLRGELDVSTPLSDDWGIRAYGAHDQGDSYLDKYSHNRDLFGVIIAGKVTPDLTLTAGYNHQEQLSSSASWIGLYLNYTDQTPISYDRSANSSPPWAYWLNKDDEAFAELAYGLGDWTIKGVLTYKGYVGQSRIMNPTYLPNRTTGFYTGDTSEFETISNRLMADLFANGSFKLFGQEHKLTMGFSYAKGHVRGWQGRAVDTGCGLGCIVLPNFNGPDRYNPALPTYNPKAIAEDETNSLWRAYLASQINFTDNLHLVAGASYAKLKDEGYSYGQALNTSQGEFNPYAGLLFDFTSNLTAYASYTTIFYPQNYLDINRRQLAPVKGTNIEGGVKANLFNKRLYLTAAVFRSEQSGLGKLAGSMPDPVFTNFWYYEAVDKTKSEGFEIEVAGRITSNWELSGGYTKLALKDQGGAQTRQFIPRQTLKMSTTYTIPTLNNASFGGQLRWQSSTGSADMYPGIYTPVKQGAYTIIDLQAGIDVVEDVRATVVVRNVTDKTYFTSLIYGSYGIAQYAAPRSFTASISYRF